MRIAVTGARGLFGPVVVSEALGAGHDVVAIDRRPTNAPDTDALMHRSADTTDFDALLAVMDGCDALIHLAAIPAAGIAPDHTTHNENVTGSYNALRAAAEHGLSRICRASSINAMGLGYSRAPVFDYFPIDENHATRAEDPYSLSKWICEQQADAFARRYDMTVVSLRLHYVTDDPAAAAAEWRTFENPAKHLWAWTPARPAARAALAALTADLTGHEVVLLAAPETTETIPSADLAKRYFASTPLRRPLIGRTGFFDISKASRLLGWPV